MIMSPSPNIGGGGRVPLSHMDRRPCSLRLLRTFSRSLRTLRWMETTLKKQRNENCLQDYYITSLRINHLSDSSCIDGDGPPIVSPPMT